MRKIGLIILLLLLASSTNAASLASKLKGRILLQVEQSGEAWYVNPGDERRYFMGRPGDAFSLMRELGVGISNANLEKIEIAKENMSSKIDADNDGLSNGFEDAIGTDINLNDSDGDGYSDITELLNGFRPNGPGRLSFDRDFTRRQAGRILLQVEQNGEAWYVNPENNLRYYLGRPADAFNVMRKVGLGVTDADLSSIIRSDEVVIDEECAQYNEALQEICMTLKGEGDYKARLDGYEKELANYKTFANNLYNCKEFAYVFTHPFTGEGVNRKIVGLDDNEKCIVYEDVPSGQIALCEYSEAERRDVSKHYNSIDPFDYSFLVSIKINSDGTELVKNGEANPLDKAYKEGTCALQSSYEDYLAGIEEVTFAEENPVTNKAEFENIIETYVEKGSVGEYLGGYSDFFESSGQEISFAFEANSRVTETTLTNSIKGINIISKTDGSEYASIAIYDMDDSATFIADILSYYYYDSIEDARDGFAEIAFYYEQNDSLVFRFKIGGGSSDKDYVIFMTDDNLIIIENKSLSLSKYNAMLSSVDF